MANANAGDAGQGAAVFEGKISDAGDAIRDRDAPQVAAFIEGIIPDAGDAVRNRVIVTCLTSRISMHVIRQTVSVRVIGTVDCDDQIIDE